MHKTFLIFKHIYTAFMPRVEIFLLLLLLPRSRYTENVTIGQGQFGLVFRKPEANGACLHDPGNVFRRFHTHTHTYSFIYNIYDTRVWFSVRFERKTFYGLIMSAGKGFG